MTNSLRMGSPASPFFWAPLLVPSTHWAPHACSLKCSSAFVCSVKSEKAQLIWLHSVLLMLLRLISVLNAREAFQLPVFLNRQGKKDETVSSFPSEALPSTDSWLLCGLHTSACSPRQAPLLTHSIYGNGWRCGCLPDARHHAKPLSCMDLLRLAPHPMTQELPSTILLWWLRFREVK